MKKREKESLFKNKLFKNILSALAVAVFGFLLLNLTFMFDAIYQSIIRKIIGLFIPLGPELNIYWLPPLLHFSFVLVIVVISWFILRSKLKTIYKAIYSVVPLATIFVTTGILFYQWQILVYLFSALFAAGVFYYLYRTKQPWIYYYTLILIGLTMLAVALLGIDI